MNEKTMSEIGVGAVMVLERVTKGAILYKNVKEGESEAFTTLYLRKSGMAEPYPVQITIMTVPNK